MSDDAATADGVEIPDKSNGDKGRTNTSPEGFGRVYDVEDRFLIYPPPKERKRLVAGFVTLLILIGVWYFVTLEDRTFEAAKQSNATADFEAYLAAYPAGKHAPAAEAGIDDLVWDELRANLDYKGYLAKYPAGRHSGSANQALDDLAYQAQRKIGTIPAFQAYLTEYPKGRHTKGADQQIARIATAQFNNCMNVCVTSKGEPDPKKNFAEECCVPVCGGTWAEEQCAQTKNEDGTLVSPPAEAPGVTPTGALPPPPAAPGMPGAPAPAAPAPAGN